MTKQKFNFKKPPDPLADITKGLPHAPEVEQGILSCLLQRPDELIGHARENLPPESFYHPVNRQIYEELIAFGSKPNVEVDLVTFSQHLLNKEMLDKVGGPSFIAEILNFVATPAHYPYYSKILDESLRQRKLIVAASNAIRVATSAAEDFSEMSEKVMVEVAAMRAAAEAPVKETSWDEELDEWAENWDLMASGKKESSMPVRWSCWNDQAGGLQSGYNIVSGASSSGKSTLLGNAMVDACIRRKRPGLYDSREMPVRMVVSRLVADLADVDGDYLFQPDRNPPSSDQKKAIFQALKIIRSSPLRIIHKPKMSAEGVCHIARKIYAEQGDCVMAVDYLQLVPKPADIEKNSNREREVAVNSATFRMLSKELDIPVLVLSQLNQDGSTRESGAINMDCDFHIKVDREKDNKTGKVTEKGVWVYKSRNGASSFHLPMFLEGSKFRFVERHGK